MGTFNLLVYQSIVNNSIYLLILLAVAVCFLKMTVDIFIPDINVFRNSSTLDTGNVKKVAKNGGKTLTKILTCGNIKLLGLFP